jgi:hypothetical protein
MAATPLEGHDIYYYLTLQTATAPRAHRGGVSTPGNKPLLSSRRLFLAVLVAATILKLVMAYCTYGTNDVQFFEGYRALAASEGGVALYHKGIDLPKPSGLVHHEGFWHPPSIVNLVLTFGAVADATGLPFPFVFRFFSILADVGTCLLVWKLVAGNGSSGAMAACLVAASPVLIFLSGFHGNTDPIMVFFVVLTTWLLITGRHPVLAGLAFGCSVAIKVWPLFLGLTFLLEIRTWRDRALFSFAAAAAFLGASFPTLFEEPTFVLGQVLGYKSIYGLWGLSRMASWTSLELNGLFYNYGRYLSLLVSVWVSVLAWRRGASLVIRCGLVTCSFLALTSGFGIQYLAWLVPWVAALGVEATLIYSVSAGMFMFVVYTYWCGGLPWYLGDSTVVGPWVNFLVWYEVTCWLTVLFLCGLFLKRAGIVPAFEKLSPGRLHTGWFLLSPKISPETAGAAPVWIFAENLPRNLTYKKKMQTAVRWLVCAAVALVAAALVLRAGYAVIVNAHFPNGGGAVPSHFIPFARDVRPYIYPEVIALQTVSNTSPYSAFFYAPLNGLSCVSLSADSQKSTGTGLSVDWTLDRVQNDQTIRRERAGSFSTSIRDIETLDLPFSPIADSAGHRFLLTLFAAKSGQAFSIPVYPSSDRNVLAAKQEISHRQATDIPPVAGSRAWFEFEAAQDRLDGAAIRAPTLGRRGRFADWSLYDLSDEAPSVYASGSLNEFDTAAEEWLIPFAPYAASKGKRFRLTLEIRAGAADSPGAGDADPRMVGIYFRDAAAPLTSLTPLAGACYSEMAPER